MQEWVYHMCMHILHSRAVYSVVGSIIMMIICADPLAPTTTLCKEKNNTHLLPLLHNCFFASFNRHN